MEKKADPGKVVNTAEGAGQRVVQAETIIGDIYPPPERRARPMWHAWGGLVAGVAVVLLVVVVVLQALPDNTATGVPAPVAASTTSSTAPTTTTTTTATTTATTTTPAPAPTSTTTTAPTTSTVTSIDTGSMSPSFTCPGGTHPLDRGRNSACEVDNPAVRPGHADVEWPGGGTTVMVIGPKYYTYISNNGGPFVPLGNGYANANGDALHFHSTGTHSGYFKIAGADRRGYCAEFWVENPGEPAEFRPWADCRSGQ